MTHSAGSQGAPSGRVNIDGLRGLALESMGWDATETRARLAAGEVSAVEVV